MSWKDRFFGGRASAWALSCACVLGGGLVGLGGTGVAWAANDLSSDVLAGSPVSDIERFPRLSVRLEPWALPAAGSGVGSSGLGFPTDLVFDAQGRGYLSELTGTVRLVSPGGGLVSSPVLVSDDLTDLGQGRDLGMTSVALHPDFLNAGTPGYGKLYTVESGLGHAMGIATGDGAGVNRLDPAVADFAPPQYVPVGLDARFKANTNHRSGVFEYTIDPLLPTSGVLNKREVLLTHQYHHAHNLSDLLFDPRAQPGDADYGLLFIGSADSGNGTNYQNNSNGPSTRPGANSANDSVYGRILRIDPLDPTSAGVDLTDREVFFGTDPLDRAGPRVAKFSVPSGALANPLARDDGAVTGDDLTWAFGLRNPYRLSIDAAEDRATTTIWASETGQQNVESIKSVTAGSDNGWGLAEGGFFYLQHSDNKVAVPTLIQGLDEAELRALDVTVAVGANGERTRKLGNPEVNRILQIDFPEFQYDHTDGVSPMGGFIYRGDRLDELQGKFLFAEYQGTSESDLADPDGRTIGDRAVLLVADPADPLREIFALTTRIDGPAVPDRVLGFAETPEGEPLVFGFNFGETGLEGVVYRIGPGSRIIPEPGLGGLVLALSLVGWRRG